MMQKPFIPNRPPPLLQFAPRAPPAGGRRRRVGRTSEFLAGNVFDSGFLAVGGGVKGVKYVRIHLLH
jgi:hypothetical protein